MLMPSRLWLSGAALFGAIVASPSSEASATPNWTELAWGFAQVSLNSTQTGPGTFALNPSFQSKKAKNSNNSSWEMMHYNASSLTVTYKIVYSGGCTAADQPYVNCADCVSVPGTGASCETPNTGTTTGSVTMLNCPLKDWINDTTGSDWPSISVTGQGSCNSNDYTAVYGTTVSGN
jgi:hypothetical protein